MLPEALKGSWLNSQGLKSEENQTWNFYFLYTCFQHRKGHSQQNNKLCLPLACEMGSDEIKALQNPQPTLLLCLLPAHLRWHQSHLSVALGHTIADTTQMQTSHFQHTSTKIHLTRIVKCFSFIQANLKIHETVTANVSQMQKIGFIPLGWGNIMVIVKGFTVQHWTGLLR